MENSNESRLLEDCKTCTRGCLSRCFLKYDLELAQKCPCRNCIVKMVCSKMCKERIRLYGLLPTSKKDLLIKEDFRHQKVDILYKGTNNGKLK